MLLEKTIGFVYVIDFGPIGFKIGKTKNLEERLRSLFKYADGTLIHTIKTNNIHRLEYYLHELYKNKRFWRLNYKGKYESSELFDLEEEDIENIKRIGKVTYTKDKDGVIEKEIRYLLQRLDEEVDEPYYGARPFTEFDKRLLIENANIFDSKEDGDYYKELMAKYIEANKNETSN